MSRILRKRGAGFTLVEVLAAVSLLVLLAAAVMSFLGVLRERQKTVGDAYERQRGLALIMERMDAEVTTCFADDGEGNSGVKGTETSLKLGSRGVGIATLGAISMQMSSTQVSEISISGGELRVSRVESQGAVPQVLRVPNVSKVRFRYHDGKSWRSDFDSRSEGGLPVAIEVSVWFAQSRAEEIGSSESAREATSDQGLSEDASDAMALEVPPDRVRIFVVPDGAVLSTEPASSDSEPARKQTPSPPIPTDRTGGAS